MRWRSHAALVVAIAFIAVAPLLFGGFTITLMNYIGIYALAALGLVLLTGVGGLDLVRPGRVRRHRRLRHRLVHRRAGRLAVDRACSRAGADRRRRRLSSARRRCGSAATSCRSPPSPGASRSISCSAISMRSTATAVCPASRRSRSARWSLGGTRAIYYFDLDRARPVMLLCRNLLDSRQGRAIRACAAASPWWRASRIDSFRMRLAVFVLAGLLAGLSGWLFAHMQRFVNPTPFDIRAGHRIPVHGAARRRRPDRRRGGRRGHRGAAEELAAGRPAADHPLQRTTRDRAVRRAADHHPAEGARGGWCR